MKLYTITEVKNTLDINCRLDDTEEQINTLEDRILEISDWTEKNLIKRNENNLKDF